MFLQFEGDEIAELAGGIARTFDQGYQFSIARDYGGFRSVGEQAFLGPVDDAGASGDTLNLGEIASQKMPASGIGAPDFGVLSEDFGRIVLRVERHRQQDEIPGREPFLEPRKTSAESRAHVGQRAPGIDEVEGYHFAAEAGEARSEEHT